MISKKTKYALKALSFLAEQGKDSDHPVLIAHLAKQEKIPRKFLEAILLELKNQGILNSKMGKGGGYFLAKPSEAIMIGRIVRATEGPLAPLSCLSQTAYKRCEECKDEHHCGIRLVFKSVHEATLAILDNTSLHDMVEKSKDPGKAPMYHI